MTGSDIRAAFDNIASHISNLETVKTIVDDLESEDLSFDAIIEILQKKIEDAEVTLRTDIRILINECRHLERRKSN
ncbi:MAG: hypothetical protein KAJ36_06680 [Candidatus Thorarchaeota archaeon]|jgi:hypothetical protein|nr:hypothetical protein [Candidatus Thorarchaeota archaeon]MCK5390155.1 hypothetical protein [Candidatus Thorarchaeota archaeon]